MTDPILPGASRTRPQGEVTAAAQPAPVVPSQPVEPARASTGAPTGPPSTSRAAPPVAPRAPALDMPANGDMAGVQAARMQRALPVTSSLTVLELSGVTLIINGREVHAGEHVEIQRGTRLQVSEPTLFASAPSARVRLSDGTELTLGPHSLAVILGDESPAARRGTAADTVLTRDLSPSRLAQLVGRAPIDPAPVAPSPPRR